MNENRKLVTVRKIDKIEQITRKDGQVPLCEIAVFGGWHAMVNKSDNFKEGDLVVFAEPDSVFPVEERWAFLEKCKYKISTRKYNNMLNSFGEPVISQGLVSKLDVLGEGNWKEGDDVTSVLGVVHAPEDDDDPFEANASFNTKNTPRFKWVPFYNKLMKYKWFRNISLVKKPEGGFPKEISKTDEERIQNLPDIISKDTLWTLTEKVDGTSSTYILRKKKTSFIKRLFGKHNYEFQMCTRNHPVSGDGTSIQAAMAKKYGIEKALKKIIGKDDWVAIQGECAGPKIQKNRLGLKENDLFVFNLIFPSGRVHTIEAKEIINTIGLRWVPIIAEHVTIKANTPESLLSLANGTSALNFEKSREGIVFRAEAEGCNLSFKAVSPEYLLKHGC